MNQDRIHRLDQLLGDIFTAGTVRPVKVAPKVEPIHWQVYNETEYRSMPAYQGSNKAEAERIAELGGGEVITETWRCYDEYYAHGLKDGLK